MNVAAVEPVCPNLIKHSSYPAVVDQDGNVTHDAFDLDYMNYRIHSATCESCSGTTDQD